MRATALALTILSFAAAPVAVQSFDQAKPGTQKPAPAQTAKPKPKPVPKLPVGARLFGGLDYTKMAATNSFNTVAGKSSLVGFGVGADVLNIWRKAFLRIGFSMSSVDGERGFAQGGTIGIPISIGVRYVDIAAGWRMYPAKKRQQIGVYGGGGLALGTISQESPNALPTEGNGSATGTGFVFFGGLDYAFTKKKNIVAGVEGIYRSVGGVLGTDGSVSGGFNENDAGGAAIRFLVGYRYRK